MLTLCVGLLASCERGQLYEGDAGVDGAGQDITRGDGGEDEAPVCEAPHACVGRVLGQPCASPTECASGACADGVCCDETCAGKCRSCLAASTGKADGTCALVSAGQPHGMDCPALPATTCGSTGKCDGVGGCLDWPAMTACAAPSCANGGTVEVGTPTCDGKGACVPGPDASCGTYACDALAGTCRNSCTVPSDCASGYFCGAQGCAKKPSGEPCAANDECGSASCGGRCCPSGAACLCPQPSPQNLLVNPGFDTGIDGWTIDLPPVPAGGPSPHMVSWVGADDADGCPYSGSIELDFLDGDVSAPPPPAISQCFPVEAGTGYDVGARMAGDGDCTLILCGLDFFTGDGCTGDDTRGSATFSVSNGPWDPYMPFGGPSEAPPDARSARFTCTLQPSRRTTCTARFDALFVSPDPFMY